MSYLDKIKSISIDLNKEKIFGITSAILWGHIKDKNSITPLIYFRKPKHISQEDFEDMISKINVTFKN